MVPFRFRSTGSPSLSEVFSSGVPMPACSAAATWGRRPYRSMSFMSLRSSFLAMSNQLSAVSSDVPKLTPDRFPANRFLTADVEPRARQRLQAGQDLARPIRCSCLGDIDDVAVLQRRVFGLAPLPPVHIDLEEGFLCVHPPEDPHLGLRR